MSKKSRKTPGQLLVQELARLSEIDPSKLSWAEAKGKYLLIAETAHKVWQLHFPKVEPGGEFRINTWPGILEEVKEATSEAIKRIKEGKQFRHPIDLPPIQLAMKYRIDKPRDRYEVQARMTTAGKDGWSIVSMVLVALAETLRRHPDLRVIRCDTCGLLTVPAKGRQKHCSARCSHIAQDRKRYQEDRRKEYLARARFAKQREVPIDSVRAKKEGKRWKFRIIP